VYQGTVLWSVNVQVGGEPRVVTVHSSKKPIENYRMIQSILSVTRTADSSELIRREAFM
jgi:hypothetical protein